MLTKLGFSGTTEMKNFGINMDYFTFPENSPHRCLLSDKTEKAGGLPVSG